MLVTVDFGVAPSTDLELLSEHAERAGATLQTPEGPLAEPPVLRGVVQFDATKLTVRVAARARPGRHQEAELALRQALREQLLAAGVTLV